LRAHQVELVDAVARALEPAPGQPIPANGLRATAVSACGTGKTIAAAHVAQRIAPYGRVLVLVPTLELLTQTVREWRREGRAGEAIAVCSLEGDAALWQAKVRATTSAPQLALWATGQTRLTVFATYSSLDVLKEAHSYLDGVHGLDPLATWDLVVVDEAHRTSGSMGKAWARIHDQDVIPANRRLYLTATPRIWEVRPPREVREGARAALPEEMAASMDDEAIFGPTAFFLPLGEAVRREILAQFQIVVLELRDEELKTEELRGADKNSELVRGKRMAALQTAVLEAMAEHDLKTLITFHARTMEAEAWAAGLPGVAKKLHADDPRRHVAPERVWADWLCGEHEPEYRRGELRQFGAGIDSRGLPVHRLILCNCKVLNEGVDVPSVDSVAIIDPKGSVVDVVQAIGRALRQKPRQRKMATILVPVFLDKDEEPDDMYASGNWRPLVSVLAALRAHDARMVEMLAIPQTLSQPLEPSAWIGDEPDEEEGEEQRLLLRFSTKRDPAVIRRFVQMQVINPLRESWARGYAAAVRYHQHFGNLRVPLDYREPETNAPLGRWISDQRTEYAAGRLQADDEGRRRVRWLQEIGMVWSAPDLAWEENLAAARAYFAEHGTLCAPQTAAAEGKPVGQWLTNLRRPGGLGKNPERAARRAAQLAAIDPDWNPREPGKGWSVDWQRMFTKLHTCVDGGGDAEHILPGVVLGGEDVGKWLARQRESWQQLTDGQRQRLTALGIHPAQAPPTPSGEAAGGGAGRTRVPAGGTRAAAFERGLAAARQYKNREGTLEGVSRKHVETIIDETGVTEVKLGVWLTNQRARRGSLTPDRADALNQLSIRWT
jgi:superfamily II DNA or RNA helicase